MVEVCPCCGMPMPDGDVLGALTPLQARVYNAIKRGGQLGLSTRLLMEVVYADDPTGGPVSTNIIAVVANQMKPRLAKFGVVLISKRGPGGGYTLKTLEQVDAANG